MNDPLNLLSVPLLTSIVYGAMYVFKQFVLGRERLISLIPSFAIILGAVLGVVAFYVAPQIMPATDPFTALLIGGASGLAATGSHQLVKQLKEGDGDKDNQLK